MDITFRQVMDWLGDEDFLDDGIIYNDKPMELGTLIISTNVGGGALAKDIKLSYWGGVPFKKINGNLEDLYWDRVLYHKHKELFDVYENFSVHKNLNGHYSMDAHKMNLIITPSYLYQEKRFVFYVHKNRWGRSGLWVEWDEVRELLKACKKKEPEIDFSKVQPGTILRNKNSGSAYVTIYQNGKYPTVVRTVTATNPVEWEIVKD